MTLDEELTQQDPENETEARIIARIRDMLAKPSGPGGPGSLALHWEFDALGYERALRKKKMGPKP